MKPRLISTAVTGARSPNATPTSTRITAWTTSTRVSRSTRPDMTASRETGVTRNRSITPPRQSEMMANPTNVEPNRPSWISSPGTKNRYASAAPALPAPPDPPSVPAGSLVSSGPNSTRYSTGCISAITTQAGLRRLSRSSRRKTTSVSRMNDMAGYSLLAGCGSGSFGGRRWASRRAATARSWSGTRRPASAGTG